MTGFGQAKFSNEAFRLEIEIRSLNSRHLDLNLRIPHVVKPFEAGIRAKVQEALQRGKIDLTINFESESSSDKSILNSSVLNRYINQFKLLANEHDLKTDVLALALRMPDVLGNAEETEIDNLEDALLDALTQALHQLNAHRSAEGLALQNDLENQIKGLELLLNEIKPFEDARKRHLRERILKALEELGTETDENRFQQELLYYLEKWDINEEKVRLSSHLQFFLHEMHHNDKAGRKLHFIAQEIGREINTIGSKSNETNMQRIVVEMKDLLEQIKEQLNNLL